MFLRHIIENRMDKQKLLSDLKQDEGFIPYAYQDSLGYWTIGYGTLIDKRGGGISEKFAEILLNEHVSDTILILNKQLPWIKDQPEAAQLALGNMAYQLGVSGLLKFKTTLDLIRKKRYNEAADNALKSLWARQTPKRAKRVTDLLRSAK